MNLALLKAEILSRWSKGQLDYNQIAAVLNAPDPACLVGDQDVNPNDVVRTMGWW